MMMVCMSHDVLMWLLSLLCELISEFPSVHYNTDASPQDRWWQDRVSEKTSDIHSRSLSLCLSFSVSMSLAPWGALTAAVNNFLYVLLCDVGPFMNCYFWWNGIRCFFFWKPALYDILVQHKAFSVWERTVNPGFQWSIQKWCVLSVLNKPELAAFEEWKRLMRGLCVYQKPNPWRIKALLSS